VPGLVVGIFPGYDPVAIHEALAAQQIELSNVKVIARSDAATAPDETPLEFISESPIEYITVDANFESDSIPQEMTRGTGVMGDSGGTSVPGLGGSGPSLASFRSHAALAAGRHLSGLAIPDDEVDNFIAAVTEGRAVVAYPDAGADSAKVAAAFKAAGLRNVRVY
jgi:hypothetical protein